LVFLGTMQSHANKDGLIWFLESIYPIIKKQIPDITLVIIGEKDLQLCKKYEDNTIVFLGVVEKLESEASNVGQKLEQRIQGGGQSPVASAVAASGEGYGSYYSQDGQDRQKPGIMDSIPKTALIAGAVVAAGGIYLLARRK